MSRKPKHGYYIKGQFVAYGSELDQELNQRDVPSKSELKRASEALQKLGHDLIDLRKDLLDKIGLPERLLDALKEAKRISDFEGRRRQMQYIGKLMRQLQEQDPAMIEAMRSAVTIQAKGSAEETAQLHRLERLRDELVASDDAMMRFLADFPQADAQHLRALVRQARKSTAHASEGYAQGLATATKNKATAKAKVYREIFQFLKALPCP